MAKAYEYDEGKVLGGSYVEENRAFVLRNLPPDFLKDFDSLILIEKHRGIEDYYHCAIFSDSLVYFYQAEGLEKPKQIDIKEYPFKSELLAIYIFDKVKNGELPDILRRAENARFSVHPSSIFLTLVKKEGKELIVSGYDLNEFVPKEKQMELDSLKDKIRQGASSN